jgi:hypothetical protein
MMISTINWSDEFAKALIGFSFVAVLGGAAGLVWGAVKHQHELDLAAVQRFRKLYGEWFATWKGWEEALQKGHGVEGDPVRDQLLNRATNVEGGFEVLTLKIATERHLSDAQLRHLGRFREGYQQLRERIEKLEELPFRVQYDAQQVKAYVAFKALSVEFGRLLRGRGLRLSHRRTWRHPALVEAQNAFVAVTSWRTTGDSKDSWWEDPGKKSATKNALDTLTELHL